MLCSIIQKLIIEFTINILKFAPTDVIRSLPPINCRRIYQTMAYYMKKPIPITTSLNGHIKEGKYFVSQDIKNH